MIVLNVIAETLIVGTLVRTMRLLWLYRRGPLQHRAPQVSPCGLCLIGVSALVVGKPAPRLCPKCAAAAQWVHDHPRQAKR